MLIRGIDEDGNPFKEGCVYSYYSHKLELTRIIDNGETGQFVLIENHGSLKKGWAAELRLHSGFKYLYFSKSSIKNNKNASIFLEKEW
jgi:beta-xylosidase